MRELVRFSLPEAIPCVRDKNNRHRKLSLRVDQLLERPFRGGDRHPSSHEHAIDVEQQPEARLRLQEGKDERAGSSGNLSQSVRRGGGKKKKKRSSTVGIKEGD